MNRDLRRWSVRIGTALVGLYSALTVFVFIYMMYLSLRPKQELLANTFGWPKMFTVSGFVKLFEEGFLRYLLNSVVILAASLAILVLLSSTVAYGLGRYKFKLKNPVRVYFLLGMMFPVQLGIVPVFLLMRDAHLLDTHLSVILILSAGISMPVFLLTEFFARLPKDVYESAVIDGASEWKTFYKIMFPLASPVVFSICIVMSVQIWNQFFVPLIFLSSEANKTLPLLVVKYTKNLLFTMDLALVSSVMATIPILLVFVLFSEKILAGVAEGAVKG